MFSRLAARFDSHLIFRQRELPNDEIKRRRTPAALDVSGPCSFFPGTNVIAVAHRAGSSPHGENSLGAIEYATSLGYKYVEVDVRATQDGSLILWHGKGLERIARNRLLDLTKLRHRMHVLGFEPPVTLAEAIAHAPDDMRFFIDLKNDGAAHLIASVARQTGVARRLCIGAFSHHRVAIAARLLMKETRERPCTAITPRQFAALVIGAYTCSSPKGQPSVSAQIPSWSATTQVISAAHAQNIRVIVWTVNDADAMHRYLDRGVDGIMSDDLELLKEVLVQRDEWQQG